MAPVGEFRLKIKQMEVWHTDGGIESFWLKNHYAQKLYQDGCQEFAEK
jgi:hypothetical protein